MISIDLRDIISELWQKKWIICIVVILSGAISFVVSKYVMHPVYEASTKVYILNLSDNQIAYSDIQVASQLANDYEELITGQNVTEEVIQKLGLDITPGALSKKISVSKSTDTRILMITVSDYDPETASQIANTVRSVAAEQIVDIMGVDAVKLVYEAKVPTSPSSPKVPHNTLLAMIFCAVIAMAVIVIRMLFNNKIETPEDVAEYLGFSVVGVIPIDSAKTKTGRKKKNNV